MQGGQDETGHVAIFRQSCPWRMPSGEASVEVPAADPRVAVGSSWPELQGALGGGRTRGGGRAGKCPSGAGKGQTENSLPEAEGRGWLSIWAPLPLSTLQFYEAGCDPLRVEPLQISWDVVEAAVACNLEFEHGVLRVEEGLRTVLLGDTHAGTTQTQGVSPPRSRRPGLAQAHCFPAVRPDLSPPLCSPRSSRV